MKKTSLLIALLIFSAFLISACSRQEAVNQDSLIGNTEQQQVVEPEAETAQYIDSQFIDPNDTVEIGEMI
jgi:PBP1b-binding outer membrane lipoprotein LpoB